MRRSHFVGLLIAFALVLMLAACSVGGQTTASGTSPGSTQDSQTQQSSNDAQSQQQQQTSGNAQAVTWPDGPVTFVCGFSAGGSTDLMMRYTAAALQEKYNVPVTVINTPGSQGWIALYECIQQGKPDGSTIYGFNTPPANVGYYDPDNPRDYTIYDYTLLANHVSDVAAIAIRADETRFTDVPSLIEYGRENTLLCTTTGYGLQADDSIMAKKLETQWGIKTDQITTDGSKESETLFLGGNADVFVANVGDLKNGHEKGLYKIICVFNPERCDLVPDVPTCKELGYGDIVNGSNRGYCMPPNADPELVQAITDVLSELILSPEVKDKVDELGAMTNLLTGDELVAFLEEEIDSSLLAFDVDRTTAHGS